MNHLCCETFAGCEFSFVRDHRFEHQTGKIILKRKEFALKRFIKSTYELRIFFSVVYFENIQRGQSVLENRQTDSIKMEIFRDESLIFSDGSLMSFSNIKTGTKIARLAPLIYFTAFRCHGGSVSRHRHVVVLKCKQARQRRRCLITNTAPSTQTNLAPLAREGFPRELHNTSTAIYYLKIISFPLSFRRPENTDIKSFKS